MSQEEFRTILLDDTMMFKDEVTAMVGRFTDTGPFTSEWGAKGEHDLTVAQ